MDIARNNSLFINDKEMDPIQLKSGWIETHEYDEQYNGWVINNKKQPTFLCP